MSTNPAQYWAPPLYPEAFVECECPGGGTLGPSPVVDQISPASSSPFPTRYDAKQFNLSRSGVPAFRFIQVWIKTAENPYRVVAYEDDEFVYPYVELSTRTGAGTVGDPYIFKLRPSTGWHGELEECRVRAVTESGSYVDVLI